VAVQMTRREFVSSSLLAGVSAALAAPALAKEPQQDTYDVVVVGAGVVGCCCARELARWDLSVLVLEAGLDIANGATRANSGIVHAGFDPTPGTLKAHYNVAGAALYDEWQADLGFSYTKNGALVLAFDDADLQTIEELKARGEQNGAGETRIIGQDELRQLEPNVSPEAVGALYAPCSGIVDPYGLTFAAAENALANGVEFLFGRRVCDVARDEATGAFTLTAEDGTCVQARAVINAAGVFSDEVNNMACAEKLAITCKRGEYQLYNNRLHPFTCTMFQTPTDKGKGVLITHAAFGNLIVGPNSVAQDSKTDVSTTAEGLDEVVAKAAKTWPDVSNDDVISTFSGLRAKNADTDDFVIGESESTPGFFNAACIDSPGLASAPAIGQELAAQVAEKLGAGENAGFNPTRQASAPYAFLGPEDQAALVAEDPAYGTTVCRDCKVTEAEIVNVLHGPLGVYSLDAVKWRTGAMMGPCQGGRCLAKICALAMRELGLSIDELPKRNDGSNVALGEGAADVTAAAQEVAFDEDVYELPRASYRIPGSRPAGVYSARCAIELLAQGALPGTNAVVWGSTELADKAANLMEQAGMAAERLADDARIACIRGEARVEQVSVEDPGGTTRQIACDTVVVSHDLAPAED
jgi:glycerol-3-phosphate dehydrogenase